MARCDAAGTVALSTVWDNPVIQTMYLEAIKWALGLTDVKLEPHALVKVNPSPMPLK